MEVMTSSASTVSDIPYSPGAGVVGWIISLAMYGASLGQLICYWYSYRQDRLGHRILVCGLFTLDSLLTAFTTCLIWKPLITCRRNSAYECQPMAPNWQADCTLVLTAAIVIIVQVFYAYRLWIITDKSVWIVSVVLTLACVGFVSGFGNDIYDLVDKSNSSALNAMLVILVSAAFMTCDIVISIFVFYFLRPARTSASTGARRIVYIGSVTVNMGFLTAALALLLLVFYSIQSIRAYAAAPMSFLPKSYVNSAFAVLNARKPTRHPAEDDREQSSIEIPHLPTIRMSASWPSSALEEQEEHSN